MSKLSLIIADEESLFNEVFINYLTFQHSKRFQTQCFFDIDSLKGFLSESDRIIDILLINPELYHEDLNKYKIKTIILLSDGRLDVKYEKMKVINRYQEGEQIVAGILNIFSEQNSDLLVFPNGSRTTKIIGIFSPCGGSGKTSVSLACSVICARMDKNVFYLNLEGIPSTKAFFNCSKELNYSHVLYYLKSKRINFNLKLDAVKMKDPITNVNYFPIQDNLLDQAEILPEEIEFLIGSLKSSKQYDFIFIDFSSYIDPNNLKAFELCNEIIIVLTNDYICSLRYEAFIKELRAVDNKASSDIAGKLLILLNKFDTDKSYEANTNQFYNNIEIKLPYISQLYTINSCRAEINLNNDFGEAMLKLLNKYLNICELP